MTIATPIFARDTTAAKLLDMEPKRFRELVAAGSLPPGKEIAPGVVRWYVPDIQAIATGAATEVEIEW